MRILTRLILHPSDTGFESQCRSSSALLNTGKILPHLQIRAKETLPVVGHLQNPSKHLIIWMAASSPQTLLPGCPLCDTPTPNTEHLFDKCKGIATLQSNSAPPLTSLLQPPYSNTQTTRALITCWAIWKTTWNSVYYGRRLNDVTTKSMKRIIEEETHWMELVHPWL